MPWHRARTTILTNREDDFSGTSIEYDGKLYLLYTGTSSGEHGFVQVQCLAESSDGITFEKYEGNPVLRAPAGYDECDFRDPKVWSHDDSFYMICGTKKDGYAKLLLFKSADLKKMGIQECNG